VIGSLVAPPGGVSRPAAAEAALSDGVGNLVPDYFPAAGFTACAGVEWSFQ
jgi:hypothetical protein